MSQPSVYERWGVPSYLGKDINYWSELDNWATMHSVDNIVAENARLRLRTQELEERARGLPVFEIQFTRTIPLRCRLGWHRWQSWVTKSSVQCSTCDDCKVTRSRCIMVTVEDPIKIQDN